MAPGLSMSDSEQETIEVSEKTKERFEEEKAKMDAADPHIPDLSEDQFMKCLLDTLEAARNGFYDEQPRKRTSDEQQERLTSHAYEENDR